MIFAFLLLVLKSVFRTNTEMTNTAYFMAQKTENKKVKREEIIIG